MSLWNRLFGRSSASRADSFPPPALDTLVEDPRLSRTTLGGQPTVTAWSAARLAGIVQTYASHPSATSLYEARLVRQCLAQFWLMAPVDQLELLYGSPIGECYRQLLAGELARQPLLPQEQAWKDSLSLRLANAFERPETTNVLLAAMAYFPPGKMRVADPLSQVPDWLQEDYARLFDPALLQRIWRPVKLLGPAGQQAGRRYGPAPSLGVTQRAGQAVGAPAAPPPPPRRMAPAFPQLATKRGNEALALAQGDAFQTRMNGLINLHLIDPTDGDVAGQLVELRRLLGQIWLDAGPEQLEPLYGSRFGELYRSLLASGFPRLACDQEDLAVRRQLAQWVADMSRPGAIQALLAALPFYPPGKISFGGGEQHMPVWLVREISTFYGEAEGPEDQTAGAPAPA
jgi:hypothetical protein